ncbi:MAG: hypothetical protein J07HQW2_01928 [Haloquadratum walsbyi J07HQW2]|uniref:Uncharacterized protein n=1 Tax=Haloquadratum walsbyi J07HQW2 TaxID=1238425 RepID=U1PSY0_9EURY|nr:MAG: hypothetical protein J07HQW2_01928 [Haloquadratum walsbyi J07HQW2]
MAASVVCGDPSIAFDRRTDVPTPAGPATARSGIRVSVMLERVSKSEPGTTPQMSITRRPGCATAAPSCRLITHSVVASRCEQSASSNVNSS